jgi:hypothetical protein
MQGATSTQTTILISVPLFYQLECKKLKDKFKNSVTIQEQKK